MAGQAFQDRYEDDVSHCYGCGRLNGHGPHIRTEWEGEVVAVQMPKALRAR